jgi:hypothetical protein
MPPLAAPDLVATCHSRGRRTPPTIVEDGRHCPPSLRLESRMGRGRLRGHASHASGRSCLQPPFIHAIAVKDDVASMPRVVEEVASGRHRGRSDVPSSFWGPWWWRSWQGQGSHWRRWQEVILLDDVDVDALARCHARHGVLTGERVTLGCMVGDDERERDAHQPRTREGRDKDKNEGEKR